jgi:DNA-binding CsgD family transcriptional regulator
MTSSLRAPTRFNPVVAHLTRHPALSPRENDVLMLLAQGCRDDEIAVRLGLAHQTVRHHVSAVKHKLGGETRVGLALIAWGIKRP